MAPESSCEVLGLDVDVAAKGFEQQAAGDAGFLEAVDAVVAVVLQVLPLAVGLARVCGDRALDAVREPAAQVDAAVVAVVGAVARLDIGLELFARLARRQDQRAGQRIAAIERALRAFQDFDLGDARKLLVQGLGVGLQHAVDDQREVGLGIAARVDATDVQLHVAGFRRLHGRHAGRQRDEVLRALDAGAPDLGGREGSDRDRHVLDALFALSRGHHDFLELAGLCSLQHGRHREQRCAVRGGQGEQSSLAMLHVMSPC